MTSMDNIQIQNYIVGIINSHHTIPPVPNDDGDSTSAVEYKYEARVFYTDNNDTTTMINYFRINESCNFKYFKSELGWEQKNDNDNYVPVKYNCENDSTNDHFICSDQPRHDLDNGANDSFTEFLHTTAFEESKIVSPVNVNGVDENKLRHLGLNLETNNSISTKNFFSVVTPKSGANNLTTICGFHTADNANDLKIQFFDTTAGNYILKYKEPDEVTSEDESMTSTSTSHPPSTDMKLILCQIPNNGGGGKRKKKTPSARSKKRSKTSQTKTLKKH